MGKIRRASQIAVVAESIGWSKLWDMALDLGWKAVMGLQMLSRAMGHHGRGNHPCHLCNDEDGPLQISLLDHILKAHWKELHLGSEMAMEKLMDMLSSSQLEVLSKFFKPYSPVPFISLHCCTCVLCSVQPLVLTWAF